MTPSGTKLSLVLFVQGTASWKGLLGHFHLVVKMALNLHYNICRSWLLDLACLLLYWFAGGLLRGLV